jgi:hypothetical protein
MHRLLNTKGQSSRLVAGLVHPSKCTGRGLIGMLQSGLLGLGCSLVDLPCFQPPLVTMSRSELLAVSRSGQFMGSLSGLLVARFARSTLSSLLASSALVSVVAKLIVEDIRGLLVLHHGVEHADRARSV